jgi:hypothetical protein
LENAYYRIEIDPASGGVVSLWDKELQKELCDPNSSWRIGQIIHETISNRAQLEQFRLVSQTRSGLEDVRIDGKKDGPIWESLFVSGTSATIMGGTRLRVEYRLHKWSKRLELHYTMRKKAIVEPEAVYVAFPFGESDAKINYEAQGGIVQPGITQLEGTSSDWHAVQNYISLLSPHSYIILGSPEIPLTQLGGLNLGNFHYLAKIEKPHVFSWVMNNYWVTNFRATQEGDFRWSYFLTSGGSPSPELPARFGWESRVPLLARVFPAGKTSDIPLTRSLMRLPPDNILLISVQPDRDNNALMLHLREISGQEVEAHISLPLTDNTRTAFYEVNVLGETISPRITQLKLGAYETKFIRIPLTR